MFLGIPIFNVLKGQTLNKYHSHLVTLDKSSISDNIPMCLLSYSQTRTFQRWRPAATCAWRPPTAATRSTTATPASASAAFRITRPSRWRRFKWVPDLTFLMDRGEVISNCFAVIDPQDLFYKMFIFVGSVPVANLFKLILIRKNFRFLLKR